MYMLACQREDSVIVHILSVTCQLEYMVQVCTFRAVVLLYLPLLNYNCVQNTCTEVYTNVKYQVNLVAMRILGE